MAGWNCLTTVSVPWPLKQFANTCFCVLSTFLLEVVSRRVKVMGQWESYLHLFTCCVILNMFLRLSRSKFSQLYNENSN